MRKNIIIVGAGILGAATAFELSKRNIHTTIIDCQAKGQATTAAAGIISPWISKRRNQAWYMLAKHGAAHYKRLLWELGDVPTGYKKVGAIYLDENRNKLEQLRDIALNRRVDAPEIGAIELLDSSRTREKFPLLREGFSSVFISGAARVDGHALRNALLETSRTNGVAIQKGKAELLLKKQRVIGVAVNGKEYFADEIIAANGVWMNELLEPLHFHIPFQAQKGEIVHIAVDGLSTNDLPVIKPPNNQYMLPFPDGRIVLGATHTKTKGFDTRFTAGGMHYILDEAIKVAPRLATGEIIEKRIGFRPFAPNHLPIFGRIPGYEGILIANGLGASGLTTGPFIGKLLAQVLNEEKLPFDLAPYKCD